MTKLLIVVLMVAACRGHADRASDKAVTKLPVPTKLPPASGSNIASSTDDHAAEIDNEYATLRAMYEAPAGATPCESIYLAIGAEQDAAKQLKRDSVFSFVAPKADFMTACGALSPKTQQCLVPSYQSHHPQDCSGVTPPDADIAKLYKLRKDLEPPKEPGQLPGSN